MTSGLKKGWTDDGQRAKRVWIEDGLEMDRGFIEVRKYKD
jgi:hypothetical protein